MSCERKIDMLLIAETLQKIHCYIINLIYDTKDKGKIERVHISNQICVEIKVMSTVTSLNLVNPHTNWKENYKDRVGCSHITLT